MKVFKFSIHLLQWQKWILLGVLIVIACATPTFFYWAEVNKALNVIRLEQQGLQPVKLMLDIIQRTQAHRGLTAIFLMNENDPKNIQIKKVRRSKAEDLEEAIANLEDYSNKIKNKKIEKSLEEITADWHQLSQRVTVRDLTVEQSYLIHAGIIRKQILALHMIMDSYHLSLDSEESGSFLISSSLMALPDLVEVLGRVREKGVGLLMQTQAGFTERSELKALLLLSEESNEEMNNHIYKALAVNSVVKDTIRNEYVKVQERYKNVASLTQEKILNTGNLSYSPPDFYKEFSAANEQYYDFARFSIAQINTILQNRMEAKKHEMLIVLIWVFLTFFLVSVITFLFVRNSFRALENKKST